MRYNFFAYISRMRYIGRWSLMRNSLPENVQEHSHMVAVIAHALGAIRRDVFHIPCDPEEYAAVALYHDSSEILTDNLCMSSAAAAAVPHHQFRKERVCP